MALAHTIKDKSEAAYGAAMRSTSGASLMDAWSKFCDSSSPSPGENMVAIRAEMGLWITF